MTPLELELAKLPLLARLSGGARKAKAGDQILLPATVTEFDENWKMVLTMHLTHARIVNP